MKYKILTTSWFEREFKRLLKRYPSPKSDFVAFQDRLIDEPRGGTSLGLGSYKWRVAIKSKTQGKSGGLRAITYLEADVFIEDTTNIVLLSLYDKSETASISKDEIKSRIRAYQKKK